MTTFNNQEDFLRALEENPQWRDAIRRQILTEELLQLPVRFHVLTQRVDTLDQKVDGLTQDMSQVKTDLKTLTNRFDNDMSQVKADLKTLTGKVDDNFNTLSGRIDNALGYNYQVKVERNLRSISGQYLQLRNITILRFLGPDSNPDFDNMIQGAIDQGLITEEQSYEVWNTDLILLGTPRGDTTPVYVAAEISITASDNDITRAVNRAGLIAQATRLPVTPVIICDNADDSRQALATRYNVAIIPHPWP